MDKNTRAVYIETPGNPKNDVPDYRRITDIVHSHGLPAIIDNTVLTPALFRPIEHGFDIVVYSTTKFIGGHGVHIGGAIVDSGKFPWAKEPKKWPEFTTPDPAYHGLVFEEALRPIGNIAYIIYIRTHWLRDTGAAQSPWGSFLTLLGLETLHLRLERHSKNALAVAEFLSKHPAVLWVNYPGLPSHPDHANAKKYLPDGQGGIVGFGIKGGKEAGAKLINSVKLFSHLANIGDAKSLIIHPATTTHSQLTPEEQAQTGVTPEFVRLSVGIEDVRDIIADLDQALAVSQRLSVPPMDGNLLDSSDSARHAKPLRYAQTATFDHALKLELGGELPGVTVAYETYGQLNGARDNAVLVCHAISGDSHVAQHTADDDPGWWDVVVGPGKPIDTDHLFVVCPNLLGGSGARQALAARIPSTGEPYGHDFPTITIGDMVETERRLLDHLGVERLRAVVGGSMGGHQALTWATRWPERVRRVIALATSPRLTSQALAFDVVGRNAIRRDPDYHDGRYYGLEHGPEVGLAIARMIGHITYLSREAMTSEIRRESSPAAGRGRRV